MEQATPLNRASKSNKMQPGAETSFLHHPAERTVPVTMRRPDKTELEFVMLMAVLVVPFAYFAIRTVLALAGL
jgi:hypothetical protein